MATRWLRLKPRICYEELEEPSFDEYVYCESCGDFVYEYCSLHGPLLVIPDDKVPANPEVPIPRAALSIPREFLFLAPSIIPGAGLGVFASRTLPSGVRFGPYRGARTEGVVSSMYCWQVYDRDNCPSHAIDGADPTCSNWLRYVNCARHYVEQNLVAYQYKGRIYYRTIKVIPRFTELLVFYGRQFAEQLHIDLSKYNNKSAFLDAIEAHSSLQKHEANDITTSIQVNQNKSHTNTQISEVTTTTLEIAPDCTYTEPQTYEEFRIDDFHYIDDTLNSECIETQQNTVSCNFNSENETYDIQFHNRSGHENERPKSKDVGIQVNFKCQSCADNVQNNATKSDIADEIASKTCDQTPGNTEYMNYFTFQANPKEQWQCKVCDRILFCKRSLKRHSITHGNGRVYRCNTCEFKTDIADQFNEHRLQHSNLKTCTLCSYSTYKRHLLRRHVESIHNERTNCGLCNYKNSKQSIMERHKAMHWVQNAKKCDLCDYLYVDYKNYRQHVLRHSKINTLE